MTDATPRLPDMLVRTTARGDRFGWRIVTLEGDRFISSEMQSEIDGSPADYATRIEARQAAGRLLIAMVEQQADAVVEGEVVAMPGHAPEGAARLAA